MARPGLYFWRTQAGCEVDLLVVAGKRLIPIEIKLGASVGVYELKGLRQCMQDLSLKQGWVIYTGQERRVAAPGIELVPWKAVVKNEVDLGF